MRLSKHHPAGILEPDMTSMIDIVFQLIAFFMFTINFTDAEQDQRVTLPSSELAQPPDAPYEHPLTIHLTDGGDLIFAGQLYRQFDGLKSALLREKQIVERYSPDSLEKVTVVIRGDEAARTGLVQRIVETCQELGYERFALRGKQSELGTLGAASP
jgi:biopolymer transport protein ExbD